MTADEARERLEELRAVIQDEHISYGELAELQGMIEFIEPGDVELLEWAGVPEELAYCTVDERMARMEEFS
jgi:hypothetical protein